MFLAKLLSSLANTKRSTNIQSFEPTITNLFPDSSQIAVQMRSHRYIKKILEYSESFLTY